MDWQSKRAGRRASPVGTQKGKQVVLLVAAGVSVLDGHVRALLGQAPLTGAAPPGIPTGVRSVDALKPPHRTKPGIGQALSVPARSHL